MKDNIVEYTIIFSHSEKLTAGTRGTLGDERDTGIDHEIKARNSTHI